MRQVLAPYCWDRVEFLATSTASSADLMRMTPIQDSKEERCKHCYSKLYLRNGELYCRRCERAEDIQSE